MAAAEDATLQHYRSLTAESFHDRDAEAAEPWLAGSGSADSAVAGASASVSENPSLLSHFLEEMADFTPTQTRLLAYYRRHSSQVAEKRYEQRSRRQLDSTSQRQLLARAAEHIRSPLEESPAAEEPVAGPSGITSVSKRHLSAGDKDDEGGKSLCGFSRLRRCGALSSKSDTDTEADPVPSGPATEEYDFDLILSATGTDPEPSSAGDDGVGVSEPETAAGPTAESSSSDELP
ncbi:hypothetical protein FJT64_003423 [Amphibalanus amphitrite]|uniref:Uncharacterized protein n=1 Tax=Amphibalanus amphitrite TaxID=1232801 RepID=A0A6A4VXX8_AMPAM|nr:hypothetical protein FJT64_003423 [Amphibalanus amphitrite]